MRLYDGLQRYELYESGRANAGLGEPVPARELASVLWHGPRDALERVVDFLVAECGWFPTDFDRHEAALDRLVELIEVGRVSALCIRPSGSVAGDVPDEDDVRELSELAAEEEEEVAAGAQVEPPMGIEPGEEIEPPAGFEVGIEVQDPDMPAFEVEVG